MRQLVPACSLRIAAAFSVILACSGCAGRSEGTPEGATETPGPGGTTVPGAQEAAGDCVEVATAQFGKTTTHKAWNAADRILAARSSSSSDGGSSVSTLKWRYRDDGQVIAYLGVEQPFQHDYAYDDEGNRTDFYLSYPAVPDLMAPSSAEPYMGTRYENEYADGRLVASVTSEYGTSGFGGEPTRSTFTEDAEGRCVEIDQGEYGKRVISYDEAGRVAQVVKTGAAKGFCVNATTTLTYDDAGRPIETNMACSGGNSGPNDGGVQSTKHTYHANGSETVEFVDGLTDVGDGRVTTTRTAACLAQDIAIGTASDSRCRVGKFQ